MSNDSSIEWTDATWVTVTGCTRASKGCDNCYAVKMSHRLENMGQSKYAGLTVLNNNGDRHFNGKVVCHEDALEIPLRWRRPRKVFVNSMSDLFHRDVPTAFIARVFAIMYDTPRHTYQVLTKRADRMAALTTSSAFWVLVRQWLKGNHLRCLTDVSVSEQVLTLPNVWYGVSTEDQEAADKRIPFLLQCPGDVRFLSVEPQVGPIDLSRWLGTRDEDGHCTRCGLEWDDDLGRCDCPPGFGGNLHWVIQGGESGFGARPFNIAWARSLRDQCEAAGVAYFLKQLGRKPFLKEQTSLQQRRPGFSLSIQSLTIDTTFTLKDPKGGDMLEWPEDLRVREMPEVRA